MIDMDCSHFPVTDDMQERVAKVLVEILLAREESSEKEAG